MRYLLMLLVLCSCGARVGVRQYGELEPPRMGKVCMLEGPAPSGTNYHAIGTIHSYMHHYGSTDAVLDAMADEARQLGANAVVSITAGQRMGFWFGGIVRPVATGTAILTEPPDFHCPSGGTLR